MFLLLASFHLGLWGDVLNVEELEEEQQVADIHEQASVLDHWIKVAHDDIVDRNARAKNHLDNLEHGHHRAHHIRKPHSSRGDRIISIHDGVNNGVHASKEAAVFDSIAPGHPAE